jgi:hypothetical protein
MRGESNRVPEHRLDCEPAAGACSLTSGMACVVRIHRAEVARAWLPALAAALVACGSSKYDATDIPLPDRERGDGEPGTSTSAPPGAGTAGTGTGTGTGTDGGPRVDGGDAGSPSYCSGPSLVACFGFEGTVTDHSPNALVPTTLQNVTFGAGKFGQAVVLTAASVIRFAPSDLWNGTSITIEAWIRQSSRNGDAFVLDADQRYGMLVRDNGELRCISAGGNADGGSIPLSTWVHVACVFAPGSVRVYTGGAQRDDERGGTGGALGSGTAIGADAPSGSPFIGSIDALRVFRQARTAPQIAAAAAGDGF